MYNEQNSILMIEYYRILSRILHALDYERIAPPYSFIYANDYPNPQALAKYLIEVSAMSNHFDFVNYVID